MPEEPKKSYREMVKERDDEFYVLVRLLDLPSASMINIITTGLADLVKTAPSDKEIEKFFVMIKKDVFDKLSRVKQMKAETKITGKYEICLNCEEKFLSDDSGEVPVCFPCLVGYKPKETKP